MRTPIRVFVLVGLLVALFLAGVVSYYASSQPDGLNKVASEKGFADSEKAHDLEDSPFAGYSTRGVDNERLSGGLAGVVGVVLTFAVAGAIVYVVRRRTSDGTERQAVGTGGGAVGGTSA